MRNFNPLIWLVASCICSCGPGQQAPRTVLATTQDAKSPEDSKYTSDEPTPDAPKGEKTLDSELLALIQKDELTSATVLRDVLNHKKDPSLSALAAVTVLRLGIQHNEHLANRALIRGTRAKDPILAALCWRWLATRTNFDLPKNPRLKGVDPVVRVMAALAASARGKIPKSSKMALGMPDQPIPKNAPNQRGLAKARVEELLSLSRPHDDGPLALAVTFVESIRKEWTEFDGSGGSVWVGRRLRRELAQVTLGEDTRAAERISRIKSKGNGEFTGVDQKLETSFLGHTPDMLHAIAVTGDSKLRIQALNALVILVKEPTNADFGAAAADLGHKDPHLRLVAARTFLILSKRARRVP